MVMFSPRCFKTHLYGHLYFHFFLRTYHWTFVKRGKEGKKKKKVQGRRIGVRGKGEERKGREKRASPNTHFWLRKYCSLRCVYFCVELRRTLSCVTRRRCRGSTYWQMIPATRGSSGTSRATSV